MIRRLVCLLFIAASTAAVGQLPGMPLNTRTDLDIVTKERVLLSNYCRLDFDGARLNPDGWKRISPYTSMSSNPGYSRVAIVSRFSVEIVVPDNNPARKPEGLYVTYRVVGYYDELGGYTAAAANERAEFQVGENKGEVLVMEVTPGMPHVSPRAAVAWMSGRLGDPKTSNEERLRLQQAVEQLSKLLPPRPAAPPPVK